MGGKRRHCGLDNGDDVWWRNGADGLVKTVLVNLAGAYYNVGKEKGKCYDRESL